MILGFVFRLLDTPKSTILGFVFRLLDTPKFTNPSISPRPLSIEN